ncbi:hypothetical protein SCA6_003861, partial [Theobroma cacao]
MKLLAKADNACRRGRAWQRGHDTTGHANFEGTLLQKSPHGDTWENSKNSFIKSTLRAAPFSLVDVRLVDESGLGGHFGAEDAREKEPAFPATNGTSRQARPAAVLSREPAAEQRTGANGKDDKGDLSAGEKFVTISAKPQARLSDVQENFHTNGLQIAMGEKEMMALIAASRSDAVQGKRGKKNKKKKNNNVRNERDMELIALAEEWMGVPKLMQEDASEHSKIHFYMPPNQTATGPQGDNQQMAESKEGGQTGPMDTLEGSGEHSPIIEKSQTTGNNKLVSIVACSRDRIEAYAENPPNMEPVSDKCMYNKEISDVPSVSFVSETNFANIEVHPRIRRRRHSNTEVSIDEILSLASDKAVDMGENDEASDEDAIS